MTSDLVATSQTRRAYDHRLREQVCRTARDAYQGTSRSALHGFLLAPARCAPCRHHRAVRPGPAGAARHHRQAWSASASPRGGCPAPSAVLRASGSAWRVANGFRRQRQDRYPTRHHQRKPFLPLAMILRIAHLEPGRYHVWKRASRVVCGLDDRSPARIPAQASSRPPKSATSKTWCSRRNTGTCL